MALGKKLIFEFEDKDGDKCVVTLRMPNGAEWGEFSSNRYDFKRQMDGEDFDIKLNNLAQIELFDKICIDFDYVLDNGDKVHFGLKNPPAPENLKLLNDSCGLSTSNLLDFVPPECKIEAINFILAKRLKEQEDVKKN